MEKNKESKSLIVYSQRLASFVYNETHPFLPQRAKVFIELLKRYSLYDERLDKIVEPYDVDEEILYLFHEKEYVNLLKKAELEYDLEMYSKGIGTDDNPVFKGMFDFAFGCVASTFSCFREIVEGNFSFAFNPLGGFHHAERAKAMGFCYLNDVAVAGKFFRKEGMRFAIVDLDAHHGNGIQSAFYDDRDVLTISIHESGATLFPGTGSERELGEKDGYGYNVNIPLPAGSCDEAYLYAVESIVPPLLKAFSPNFVVVLAGTDIHMDDPLSHLKVTAAGYKKALEIVNGVADKIIALGAGGYNMSKSPALWALAYSVFTGRKIVDQYAGSVGGMMYGPTVDLSFLLEERQEPEKDASLKAVEKVVNFIKKEIFPIFGLR